jgi:hypothetical protein
VVVVVDLGVFLCWCHGWSEDSDQCKTSALAPCLKATFQGRLTGTKVHSIS